MFCFTPGLLKVSSARARLTPHLLIFSLLIHGAPAFADIETAAAPKSATFRRGKFEGDETSQRRYGIYAAIGFPHMTAFGATVHFGRHFSLSGEAGRTVISSSDERLIVSHAAILARLHPFGSGGFLGFAEGLQWTGLTATRPVASPYFGAPGIATIGRAARTVFITPMVGYLSTVAWGITLGADIGYQIPLERESLASYETFEGDGAYAAYHDHDFLAWRSAEIDTFHEFANRRILHLTILRLGFTY